MQYVNDDAVLKLNTHHQWEAFLYKSLEHGQAKRKAFQSMPTFALNNCLDPMTKEPLSSTVRLRSK